MAKPKTRSHGTGSDHPAADSANGGRWKRIMAWVGGVTAILSLIFGLQKLISSIRDTRHEKQQTHELLAVADMQQRNQQYSEAWATLARAEQLDADNKEVQRAEEDVAMKWLREARPGQQTFSEFVKPLLPVVERGALRAQGARKADLLAHVGWADFLKWRDGARELTVENHYKDALQIDPRNPFAHAMWGHWILFKGGAPSAAREHFDAALSSGRERDWVRYLELAALRNRGPDASGEELLRVANEMRQQNEKIADEHARYILWASCYSDVAPGTWQRSPTRISPQDEIATLRWLYTSEEAAEGKANMIDLCEARAHAWAGDTVRALGILHTLETSAPGDALRYRARQSVEQLKGRSR